MLENMGKADLSSAIFKTSNLYSRITLFETFYSKKIKEAGNLKEKADAFMTSLGIFVYAEYYGSKRMAPDPHRRMIIVHLIKQFILEPAGLPFSQAQDKELKGLPDLSPAALDFILGFEEVAHFVMIGEQCYLSPIMFARILTCETPEEVLIVWTDALEKKKGLRERLISTEDSDNLPNIFVELCLNRIEVPARLLRDGQLSILAARLLSILLDEKTDFTLLRRPFLMAVISALRDNSLPVYQILSSILGNKETVDTRLIFDFATILDLNQFCEYHASFKSRLTDQLLMSLLQTSNSAASLHDKKQLLIKTAEFLSIDQLYSLASEYATLDWGMFSTIRALANPPARSIDNTTWFDLKERESTNFHNSSWPLCFQKLDAIMSKYEASLSQKDKGMSSYLRLPDVSMQSLRSIPTMATVSSAASLITGHDSHREALKELFPLFEDGISLPEKPQNPLLGLFISDFKNEYPNIKSLKLEMLPITLKERLEIIRPGLIAPFQTAVNSEAKVSWTSTAALN